MTKLKLGKKTQELKLWGKKPSKTQIVTILKNSNCDKSWIMTTLNLWEEENIYKGLLVGTYWHLNNRWAVLWAAFCDSRDVYNRAYFLGQSKQSKLSVNFDLLAVLTDHPKLRGSNGHTTTKPYPHHTGEGEATNLQTITHLSLLKWRCCIIYFRIFIEVVKTLVTSIGWPNQTKKINKNWCSEVSLFDLLSLFDDLV